VTLWKLIKSVDTFVSHMARDELGRAKWAKLDALQLSDDESDSNPVVDRK
jgi:hypothetical protein